MAGGYEIGLWAVLIIASITDLLWGKIFNWFIVLSLVLAFAVRVGLGNFDSAAQAAIAVGVAFILFYPLYLIKAMAAGDVKLLMAVGAWSDARLVLTLGVSAILIGAVVGSIILVRKKGLRGSVTSVGNHLKSLHPQGNRMPFAPAFLCAFIFVQVAEKYHWSLF